MSLIEVTITIALAVFFSIAGLNKYSGYIEANEAETAAIIANGAALSFVNERRCDAQDAGQAVTANVQQLISGGHLTRASDLQFDSVITWSVSLAPTGRATVTANSSNRKHLIRIASRFKGVITGNAVSFMAIKESNHVDDSAVGEFVNLYGGLCVAVPPTSS